MSSQTPCLFRISKNTSGKIRTTLCFEDIVLKNMEVLKGFGLLSINRVEGEDVYFFKEPFRVPRFNLFYASKIKSISDPYLTILVRRLLYLNPSPDKLGLKQMAEFILTRFVVTKKVESEVNIGKVIDVPVIPHEELVDALGIINQLTFDFIPDTEDFVMYSRSSRLEKKDKIKIKAQVRSMVAVEYFQKAIHTATEYLMEEDMLLKINSNRIRDTRLVTTSSGIASNQTIRKYMSDRTKRVMDEHNEWAPFKSETSYRKYQKFLSSAPSSIELTAKGLNISKSTVIAFREARKKFNE